MPKIPIFDLDGSLLDSAPDIAKGLNAIRKSLGLTDLSVESVRRNIGGGLRALLRSTKTAQTEAEVELARDIFMRVYSECFLEDSKPFDGVEALLADCPIAGLVSNKPRCFGAPILDGLAWTFDVEVFGDDGHGRKPDPGPLVYAVSQLGCMTSDVVYFGDTDVDVIAAESCGIEGYLFPWSHAKGYERYRLNNLAALRACLHS